MSFLSEVNAKYTITLSNFEHGDWSEKERQELEDWKSSGSGVLTDARLNIPRMPDGKKRQRVLDALAAEVKVKVKDKGWPT